MLKLCRGCLKTICCTFLVDNNIHLIYKLNNVVLTLEISPST